jgi:CheY-like chemotaxis protein
MGRRRIGLEKSYEIILIEDSPFDAELTLRALQNKGLARGVMVFSDGEEALEYLFSIARHKPGNGDGSGRLPRAIFLDLNLPKMSGFEVLSQIKKDESTRLIPVVMLTSSQEESDVVESYQLGVNSYLVKPVEYDEFSEAVGDLGQYWLCRNKAVY